MPESREELNQSIESVLQATNLLSPFMSVEVLRPHRVSKHDIIVEIDEVVGKARNAMEVAFNGWRAVRRQVGPVLKDVLA